MSLTRHVEMPVTQFVFAPMPYVGTRALPSMVGGSLLFPVVIACRVCAAQVLRATAFEINGW